MPPERPVVGDAGEALDGRVAVPRELGLWIAELLRPGRPVGKMNSCSASVETSV
jgi:hypothetical protein